MPSPIIHSFAGYLIYQANREKIPDNLRWHVGRLPLFLLISVVFSLLPDVDAVFGLLARDFSRFHNNGTHSLVTGIAFAFFIAGVICIKLRSSFFSWFTITLLSYWSHVILDFFTYGGRGVMLLWPFTTQRFESSLKLFYGVRWSEGFLAVEHLMTLTTEILFVLLVILIFRFFRRNFVASHEDHAITNSEREL